MGLFSRKKTRTTVTVEKLTLTRIVKLSYIQSIIINGGTAKTEDFAGISGPQTNTVTTTSSSRNRVSRSGRFTFELAKDKLGWGNSGAEAANTAVNYITAGIGNVAASLFGSRTTYQTTVSTKEAGWTLVKTWSQPQFDVIRYAIGIKEVGVTQFQYAQVSEMTSKVWNSPKEIIKVRLIVDQFIPPEFPQGTYIEYYIKPDDSSDKWLRINPIDLPTVYSEDNPTKPVPRIISFNGERPVTSALEESYMSTETPIKGMRIKVIIKRPENSDSTLTPILRSYRLIMTPRGGL